jgi:valyl-tRNA synthetase
LNRTIKEVNRQLDRFHFNEAAKIIYEFTWSDFCDWYIEIAKTRFRAADEKLANQARSVAVHVLRTILALLHPYAPFITEELWSHFKRVEDKDLIVSAWPGIEEKWINSEYEERMTDLMKVITAVRTIRSGMNVPPAKVADMFVRTAGEARDLFMGLDTIIKSLANIGEIKIGEKLKKPPHSATAVVQDLEIFIPLEDLIDFDLEHARLDKRRHELERLVDGTKAKLENEKFINRAPGEVIARERQKLLDISSELEKLKSNLEMLS